MDRAAGNLRQAEVSDIENLRGSDHDDVLAGDFRDNIIRGQAGDDRLEGGAGDDYFYFYSDGGNDTILDFGNGEDRIVLRAFEDIQSIDDLTIQQQGADLVIDLSAHGGGTITLQDYDQADLMDSHLVFHAGESATVA